MKQTSKLASFTVIVIVFLLTGTVLSQTRFNSERQARSSAATSQSAVPESIPLLAEDFPFSGNLINAGWSAHSGSPTNQQATTGGLVYAGYPGSGAGNAALVNDLGGEDVNRPLAVEQNVDGTVIYYSFLVRVTEAADRTGDYFIHIGDRATATSFTSFAARVFARTSGANVNFGLSNTSTAPIYGTTNFAKNTTYLLIVKYTINVSGNDATSLWVISSGVPASEAAAGTPEVTETTTTGQNVIDAIALRQGSSTTSTQNVVDAIRVGNTWASITKATSPRAPNDYDGDGRTDYVVLRDSNGATAGGFIDWYIQLNASGAMQQIQWGNYDPNTEDLAPADYDGDGKTDVAVWRRAALSNFYIILSATNTLWTDQLGELNDDPVPGDYNADGNADLAVFREDGNTNTSNWYYRPNFFSDFVTIPLNASGARAGGDYNGDGFYDPAVFHDGGGGVGQFTILLSGGGGTTNVNLGTPTDFVAPGDYDGDGKTDQCVIRNVGGTFTWEFKRSIDGATVSDTWGLQATDLPTPGDYNGDGKWDYAVWREGDQSEFLIMTPVTRLIFSRPWGTTGDFPVATASGVSNGI
jgi:hypothetical protein